jgi:hypothetical protein
MELPPEDDAAPVGVESSIPPQEIPAQPPDDEQPLSLPGAATFNAAVTPTSEAWWSPRSRNALPAVHRYRLIGIRGTQVNDPARGSARSFIACGGFAMRMTIAHGSLLA